jgi:hypothetical protein
MLDGAFTTRHTGVVLEATTNLAKLYPMDSPG